MALLPPLLGYDLEVSVGHLTEDLGAVAYGALESDTTDGTWQQQLRITDEAASAWLP